MKKYLVLLFCIFLNSLAFADFPEVYSLARQDKDYDCKIELTLETGAYQHIKLQSKLTTSHVLTDEELISGKIKAWPEEILWERELDQEKKLWKEGLADGTTKKLPGESIEIEDKIKIYFNSTKGNFRSPLDLYVKIIPTDSGKSANIYFAGARNSKITAKELFNEKFPDTTKFTDNDNTDCLSMKFDSLENVDVSGQIWGVKTLTKK